MEGEGFNYHKIQPFVSTTLTIKALSMGDSSFFRLWFQQLQRFRFQRALHCGSMQFWCGSDSSLELHRTTVRFLRFYPVFAVPAIPERKPPMLKKHHQVILDEVTFYDFALGWRRSHKKWLRHRNFVNTKFNFVNTKLNFIKYTAELWCKLRILDQSWPKQTKVYR